MRPMCFIHHICKDAENGVIISQLYEAVTKEFYFDKEYPITTPIAEIAKKEFKDPILRGRLINWRGLGNENELWFAQDENNLHEVQWFADGCQLMNGATINTRISFRDRVKVTRESCKENNLFGVLTDTH